MSETYHDAKTKEQKEYVASAAKKYGNDEALWPKDVANKEYDMRKRTGAKGTSFKSNVHIEGQRRLGGDSPGLRIADFLQILRVE